MPFVANHPSPRRLRTLALRVEFHVWSVGKGNLKGERAAPPGTRQARGHQHSSHAAECRPTRPPTIASGSARSTKSSMIEGIRAAETGPRIPGIAIYQIKLSGRRDLIDLESPRAQMPRVNLLVGEASQRGGQVQSRGKAV